MDANVLHQIEDDDVFSQFLEREFDAKAHAAHAIQGVAICQQLAKLAEGINLLDQELHSQVVAHHEDLLSQATGVETLEGVLQMMQTRIQSLLAAIERIRSKVTEPYNKIVSRTQQLRRLQETCDLLRIVIRIMYLTKRLHGQLQGGAREISKAAQSLNELEYLSEGVDLTGLEVIESDRRFIRQAWREVETQGSKMLEQGMETQNQAQVATSLQVFYNLGSLESTVMKVVEECLVSLRGNVRGVVDVQAIQQQITKGAGPGKASMPAPGNSAAFRATLWTNMEKLMDTLYSVCAQAQHLQKVLVKKRDPVTHVCFIEHLAKAKGSEVNILRSFWQDAMAILGNEFSSAAEANTFLKQAFEGEYPKLLRLYGELWRRLHPLMTQVEAQVGGMEVGLTADNSGILPLTPTASTYEFDPEKMLKSSLAPFETAYLAKSLSRLFDPINLVFTSGTANPPTTEEVEGIAKSVASELSVASVDAGLIALVAKNVAKTIQLFTVKSEQLLTSDGEATQVIGAPTPGQTKNAAVVNALYLFHQAISKVVGSQSNPPQAAIQIISSALEGVVVLMGSAIQPLLESVSDSLEAIILTIHNEDFSLGIPGGQSDSQQCSLYMRELQDFVSRVQSTYMAQFDCSDFIRESIAPIAGHCVELFVRHASLVRPLGEGGKMRLAADFAQMELAISPLCHKPSDLGKPYRLLRACRPLLFQTSEHMASTPALGEIIPHSILIHFLFGRAPQDLKAPHQAAGWSVSRYSQWLEDHTSEKDRLSFIKGSLESYVQMVRAREGKEFASVYPIMLDLLQKGLQITTT